MARYGINVYGTGIYGLPTVTEYATPMTVVPQGYDKLLLSWDLPGGTWTDAALVRSSYGFPMSINKGTVLFNEAKDDAPLDYLDGDTPPNSPGPLQPGRFYYYTLFVFSTDRLEWVPSAQEFGLVTVDHEYRTALWDLLPEVYHENDRGTVAQPTGPLERFMGLFGYQLDVLRSEAETLLDVADVDLVSGGLLPILTGALGAEYEPELGMQISRAVASNAVYLAKIRGTKDGIEGIATSYTGYAATAVLGPNLLLDKDDSGWISEGTNLFTAAQRTFASGSTDPWATQANCTLTVDEVGGNEVLQLQAPIPGDMVIETTTGTGGFPVTAGTFYLAEVYSEARTTVEDVRVDIEWFDSGGSSISTSTGTASTNSTSAFTRHVIEALAPATAEYASMQVTVEAAGSGDEHVLDDVVFRPAYLGHWVAVQNATLDRYPSDDLTPAQAGTGSLRIVAGNAGTDAIATSGEHSTRTLVAIVEPSTDYVASAYVQNAGTASNVSIEIEYFDEDGASLGATGSTPTADTGAWVRREVTATSGATAVWAAINIVVATPATDEVHYVGALQLEAGTTATTWEDGRKIHVYLSPERQNLVPNPSLEVDTTDWSVQANCSIARSVAEAYSGSASLEITSTAAGDAVASTSTGTGGMAVTEAENYTVSAYFRSAAVAVDAQVGIRWYDSGGTPIGALAYGTASTTSTSEWTRVEQTEVAPASAAFAAAFLLVDASGASEVHYADAVLFEEGEFLKEYFDASLDPEKNYLWEGTEHDSISDLYTRRAIKDDRLQDILAEAIPAGATFETHYGETPPGA